MTRGQWLLPLSPQSQEDTHSDEAGGEPGLPVRAATPPPVLVGGFQDLDDVPGLEAQLLLVHGHVVPQGLGADHAAIADQLEWRGGRSARSPGTLGSPGPRVFTPMALSV